ncbi:MAG: THUMP domain-containing protein [Polyangiaceae bacterium]
MLFLVRCTERGKEPHAAKNKLRNDIADRLRAAVPDVRLTFDVGRIYVEHARDIRDELARLHGVLSFSPCTACDLDDLEAHVTSIAAPLLAPSRSFRVKVRRSGQHSFSSNAKAAELGAHLLARVPGAKVDLSSAEVEIVIEIRDRTCHVCTEVIPGLDAQLTSTGAEPALEGGATMRGGAVEVPGPTASASASDEPRFLVDAMLGTLASRLRAFGYDTGGAAIRPIACCCARPTPRVGWCSRRIASCRDRRRERLLRARPHGR